MENGNNSDFGPSWVSMPRLLLQPGTDAALALSACRACIEAPLVIKKILDHLKTKDVTRELFLLTESRVQGQLAPPPPVNNQLSGQQKGRLSFLYTDLRQRSSADPEMRFMPMWRRRGRALRLPRHPERGRHIELIHSVA